MRYALFPRALTRRLIAAASTLALATGPFGAPLAGDAHAQSASRIAIGESDSQRARILNLGLDKSLVVDLPREAHDILVANPQVADAVMRTSKRIYLFGKQVGQTNVFVFDGRGNQIAAMDIRIERDIAGLEETLNRLIKNADIRAEMISDNVVLTGTVPTPQDSAKAVSLAQIFVDGGEATQGNFSGGSQSLFTQEESSSVVNLLKIDGEDQVQLKVTISEVSRAVVKQLGINTSVSSPSDAGLAYSVFGRGTPMLSNGSANSGTFSYTQGLNSITAQLRAMELAGVMRTLAEPTLTAVSGEEAHFRVGGRMNITEEVEVDPETGQTRVQYEGLEYGVALTFTPTVLTAGRISLKIRTEVKEPTTQGGVTLNSVANRPGVRQRIASTVVELPSGGSMVIAGLIQDEVRQMVTGMPGLKSIPVLGSLFRSREFVRNESEVMIIVTPLLVRPVARSKLALPDENLEPVGDATGIFMGRLNKVYGTRQGNLPKGRYTGSIGFILK